MRGGLLTTICWVFLCGICAAQRVQFTALEKPILLERMKSVPETNAARASKLKELFIAAGCNGNSLLEEQVEGTETPNVICTLGTSKGNTIIVGAHYQRSSSPQKSLDNWSGASLLPALYESLRGKKRDHSFIFVAFADDGSDPVGAESFAHHLSSAQLNRAEAMINLDSLGFSPTKVWTSHSNKELVHSLFIMVYALKIPASQIDLVAIGHKDAEPFSALHIPEITIHSLTQQNGLAGATTQSFRPGNYYDSYRLLCGYLAFLDQSLKPKPHPE